MDHKQMDWEEKKAILELRTPLMSFSLPSKMSFAPMLVSLTPSFVATSRAAFKFSMALVLMSSLPAAGSLRLIGVAPNKEAENSQ